MTEPAYRLVAEDLARRIRSGEFPIGSKLPSITEVAGASGETPSISRDALLWLVDQGWAVSRPGSGYWVTSVPSPPPEDELPWREALERRVEAIERRLGIGGGES